MNILNNYVKKYRKKYKIEYMLKCIGINYDQYYRWSKKSNDDLPKWVYDKIEILEQQDADDNF